jgi:hypothetical protein
MEIFFVMTNNKRLCLRLIDRVSASYINVLFSVDVHIFTSMSVNIYIP